MIAVPAMSPVPVVPVVLVRAPIAALAVESDVGTLPSVPLVMRAHTASIYP